MKRSRFSEEQIIEILRLHSAGAKPADLCRQHGISEATLYNAHSDDCDHRFRRIATTCSDRSRPVWRGRLQRRWMLMVMSVFRGLVKHGKSRPGSQQEGPARDAERPYG